MNKPNMTIEGIKNIKTVGTLVASSRYLSKKILRGIDFSKDLTVVELEVMERSRGVFSIALAQAQNYILSRFFQNSIMN
jgi:phospholipid N-methyltransferase